MMVESSILSITNRSLAIDPYSYTTGRWLRNGVAQCQARYISFDYNRLRRRVIELSPGARVITRSEKEEGSFNEVSVSIRDSVKRIVARLPTRVAGPPRLTTDSEVATIKYRDRNGKS